MQYLAAAFAFLLVLIGVYFLAPVSASMHSMEYLTTTDSGNLTTAPAITAANITLSEEIYRAATSSVVDIASDNSSDVPFAASYDEDTQNLLVGGLQADSCRIINVEYKYDNPSNPPQMSNIITFAFIGLVIALIILLVMIPTGIAGRVVTQFRR